MTLFFARTPSIVCTCKLRLHNRCCGVAVHKHPGAPGGRAVGCLTPDPPNLAQQQVRRPLHHLLHAPWARLAVALPPQAIHWCHPDGTHASRHTPQHSRQGCQRDTTRAHFTTVPVVPPVVPRAHPHAHY